VRLSEVPGMEYFTSPHVLRHTLATALLEVTTDARLVQEVLGHRSMQTLRVYTQIPDRRKRAVYASGGVVARALHDLTANPR
jgi:integrase/recombinase XerC